MTDGLACFSDVVKAGLKKRRVARFECSGGAQLSPQAGTAEGECADLHENFTRAQCLSSALVDVAPTHSQWLKMCRNNRCSSHTQALSNSPCTSPSESRLSQLVASLSPCLSLCLSLSTVLSVSLFLGFLSISRCLVVGVHFLSLFGSSEAVHLQVQVLSDVLCSSTRASTPIVFAVFMSHPDVQCVLRL